VQNPNWKNYIILIRTLKIKFRYEKHYLYFDSYDPHVVHKPVDKGRTGQMCCERSTVASLRELDPPGLKLISIKVEPIKTCIFNHYIEVQGVVDGDQNVAVSPQIAGVVTGVYVKEGSAVQNGQLLAELDAQVLKQSLDEVKTQLDLANNLYIKQKALWDKNIGSEVHASGEVS
jgi:hypothetical protein